MLVRVLQEIVSSYLMKQSALLNSSAGAEASKIQDKAKASPESLNSSRQAPYFGKIEVELEHTLCVPRARAELVRLFVLSCEEKTIIRTAKAPLNSPLPGI